MKQLTTPDSGAVAAQARIDALIAAYPDLNEDDLRRLLHWYRKEASSYDVAMLSARDDLRPGYERFYKDHIERISPFGYTAISIIVLLCAIGVYAIINYLR
ncbi:hypothetical protein M2337_002041 [Sphingobium sp. B2D3A]|uniref:hypothetical protein n=1 Tax=unclassified Sphingobium TaxID=2611147 RepID=UPI00222538A0|nr:MULTISPECIES: hypothetical protein [unclassified Sphingobium]MCW2337808.1 hypothetical protein [Sphingobium sp. B2D3A]MCW2350562.1 hypothetical protein [Sphingobium sp. B12D2B]MCW2369664.1 hypothetical protein [Sphingobium sp. B11D3D]MCW2381632.1 hypothetical protein [Sphingobium sp. B2D3B]MCW2384266.1 hypothetical protein [Sphingobium sp. B2D3D]